MESKTIACDISQLETALDFIEETLTWFQLKRSSVQQAMLLAEETIVKFIELAPSEAQIRIQIRRKIGAATIQLQAPGRELKDPGQGSYAGIDFHGDDFQSDDMSYDVEMTLRNIVLHSYAEKIRYKHKSGFNTVQITAGKPERAQALITFVTLLGSAVLGLGLRLLLPAGAADALLQYLLEPIVTMFINILHMLMVPVAFFSIVSCVARYTGFSGFGRVGAKVLILYALTSLLAACVGIAAVDMLHLAPEGILSTLVQGTAAEQVRVELSALDTVVGIIPTNLVRPFLEENNLQIICIALLVGVAVGKVGDYSAPLQEIFESCHILFQKILSMVSRVIPLAVFGAVTSAALQMGTALLAALLEVVCSFLLGLVLMVGLYCLMLAMGRVDPRIFLKKFSPTIVTILRLGSNGELMPETVRTCRDRLGISPKVYNFSLPLGTTINLDASCIYLAVAGLSLARLCGIGLTSASVLPVIFTVLILSAGAPNASGSSLVSTAMLLEILHVPMNAISLIIGLDAIIGMFCAASNTIGDVAVSVIVARMEKLIDMDVYNKK